MKKNFRSIKATLIIGLLLVSLSSMMIPVNADSSSESQSNSFSLFKLESYVNLLGYDKNLTNVPIQPRGTGFSTQLNLEYGVTYSAGLFNILGSALLQMHRGRTLKIQIEALDHPEWTSVSVSQWPTVTVSPDKQPVATQLTVKVNENAPAFGAGDIKLRITVPDVGLIKGMVNEVEIPFSAGYIPLVKAQFPEGESEIVGPMDTAVFPIELQNMGNARTRVSLQVLNVPDGWAAIITNDVLIEEGKGSKSMAYLTVKPPKGFGYHDDSAGIVVTYTPEMAENPQFVGETRTVDVLVESRGFSIIGMEVIILPLIAIIVVLILLYYFIKRK